MWNGNETTVYTSSPSRTVCLASWLRQWRFAHDRRALGVMREILLGLQAILETQKCLLSGNVSGGHFCSRLLLLSHIFTVATCWVTDWLTDLSALGDLSNQVNT